MIVSALCPHSYLGQKIIRRYLLERGFDTREPTDHEDKSRCPIPAEDIRRFVFYGDPDFIDLTGCDEWSPPL